MRPDELYLREMIDLCESAHEKVKDIDFDHFVSDDNLRLAVTHLVVLVGEAASQVSDELKEKHPRLPWREATVTRNRIVHGYFTVEYSIVYGIARNNLPLLAEALKLLL